VTPNDVGSFTIHIFAWSDLDKSVVGPSLFDSALETTNPARLGYREHRFDNLNISVEPFGKYIAYIDQVEFASVFTLTNRGTYSDGRFWATDRAITDTWGLDGDGAERNPEGRSMSFIAEFSTTEVVPEPASVAIWTIGALCMGFLASRKKKLFAIA
jgi:hypothetical protein